MNNDKMMADGLHMMAARQLAGADHLITGDKDLLALAGRYPIVTPAGFLGCARRFLTASVLRQTLRQRERNTFLHPCQLPDFGTRQLPDAVDHSLDQYFRGRGARRHADTLLGS